MPTLASNAPDIRELAPMTTAAVRVWRTFEDLPAAFPQSLPLVAERVAALGGAISGPPYARYHQVIDGRIDVEIGAPVAAPVPGLAAVGSVEAGTVGASMLPGGRGAVLTHVGPYATLGDSWHRAEAWLADIGQHASGPGWEWYIDNPDEVPPEELRTEIIFPLDEGSPLVRA